MKNEEYYQVPGIVLGIDNMFNAMGLYRSDYLETLRESDKSAENRIDTPGKSTILDKK